MTPARDPKHEFLRRYFGKTFRKLPRSSQEARMNLAGNPLETLRLKLSIWKFPGSSRNTLRRLSGDSCRETSARRLAGSFRGSSQEPRRNLFRKLSRKLSRKSQETLQEAFWEALPETLPEALGKLPVGKHLVDSPEALRLLSVGSCQAAARRHQGVSRRHPRGTQRHPEAPRSGGSRRSSAQKLLKCKISILISILQGVFEGLYSYRKRTGANLAGSRSSIHSALENPPEPLSASPAWGII